ncbi:MAG: PD40 domain-containing protein [Candidatus Yanofskybacteria bacterium]|nr:PD40 domain-containing protein [Candidatus Yanofskybacteria bacterium]
MKIRRIFAVLLAVGYSLLAGNNAYAQFGKNKVNYESKKVLFYQSEHVDFYHWQDVADKSQIKYLAHIVDQVERSHGFLSGYLKHELSKRPSVVFYRTHSAFAATHILGEHFIPEGVLAFALPVGNLGQEYVLAIKLDRPVEEYDATVTHEMAHIFQFDMGPNLFQRIVRNSGPPKWIMEGGAAFLADEYNTSRSDDLREDVRRGAGANPEKDLPTFLDLNEDSADPYTFGPMTLQFVKAKFGDSVVKEFLVQAFKDGKDLIKVLYELTQGGVTSAEQFDEMQRDFWREKFGPEMLSKSRPYQENEYFRGRHIVPAIYPEPVVSPVVSPNGKKLAVITVSPNYGIVLAVIPALLRENPAFKPIDKKDRSRIFKETEDPEAKSWKIEILTPFFPPKHFEDLTVDIQVSNLSWVSSDGKELIAFFAQKGRDHTLFIVDPNNRKNLRSFPIPMDNALSPSFTPDGKKVIFSASQNITRDLFVIDLETKSIVNLTNDDTYDEDPAVSPDGTKIAYVSFWGGFRKLFLLDLATGEKRQLTFRRFNDSSPSWSDSGRLLVYSSDETDGVSNLYTIDLKIGLVSQWTDFGGRKFTPRFARGENDRVYYAHRWQYDQYRNYIGPNFELFDILLKKPYRSYITEKKNEQSERVFIPDRDLFKFELDENQLLNPTPAPEKWNCNGGNFQFGVNSYYGMFGQSYFGCSNLLQTKQHLAQLVSYGDFRVVNYSYLNQERRASWFWGGNFVQMPLRYQFYDIVHRDTAQPILNPTWVKEKSLNLSVAYPRDKFNRWELFSRLRHRSFSIGGFFPGAIQESIEMFPEYFTANDIQLTRFFNDSTGSNLSFGAAYVRDTILYSGNTWGPAHGNALRAQVEFAPPAGKEFQGYTSANIAARTYHYLGGGSLFAGRAELMANSRANGDFVLLCGPERLRGCEYGSIIGNQVGYVSAELRFPIPGTYLLYQGVRGFLFADAAYAKFNGERFPVQKLRTYGFGLNYVIPFVGLPGQTVWTRNTNGKWDPTFYITLQW